MIINDVESKTDIALPPETVINIRNIQATNQPNTDTLPHHHLPRVEAMVRPMSSVTSRMLAAASTLSLLGFSLFWESMAVETVEKKFSTWENYEKERKKIIFFMFTFDLTAFFTMELLKDRRFSLNLSKFSRSDFSWLTMSPTSSFILRLCFGAEMLVSIFVK